MGCFLSSQVYRKTAMRCGSKSGAAMSIQSRLGSCVLRRRRHRVTISMGSVDHFTPDGPWTGSPIYKRTQRLYEIHDISKMPMRSPRLWPVMKSLLKRHSFLFLVVHGLRSASTREQFRKALPEAAVSGSRLELPVRPSVWRSGRSTASEETAPGNLGFFWSLP